MRICGPKPCLVACFCFFVYFKCSALTLSLTKESAVGALHIYAPRELVWKPWQMAIPSHFKTSFATAQRCLAWSFSSNDMIKKWCDGAPACRSPRLRGPQMARTSLKIREVSDQLIEKVCKHRCQFWQTKTQQLIDFWCWANQSTGNYLHVLCYILSVASWCSSSETQNCT